MQIVLTNLTVVANIIILFENLFVIVGIQIYLHFG